MVIWSERARIRVKSGIYRRTGGIIAQKIENRTEPAKGVKKRNHDGELGKFDVERRALENGSR